MISGRLEAAGPGRIPGITGRHAKSAISCASILVAQDMKDTKRREAQLDSLGERPGPACIWHGPLTSGHKIWQVFSRSALTSARGCQF